MVLTDPSSMPLMVQQARSYHRNCYHSLISSCFWPKRLASLERQHPNALACMLAALNESEVLNLLSDDMVAPGLFSCDNMRRFHAFQQRLSGPMGFFYLSLFFQTICEKSAIRLFHPVKNYDTLCRMIHSLPQQQMRLFVRSIAQNSFEVMSDLVLTQAQYQHFAYLLQDIDPSRMGIIQHLISHIAPSYVNLVSASDIWYHTQSAVGIATPPPETMVADVVSIEPVTASLRLSIPSEPRAQRVESRRPVR